MYISDVPSFYRSVIIGRLKSHPQKGARGRGRNMSKAEVDGRGKKETWLKDIKLR